MDDLKARYGPWAVVAGASEGTGRAFAKRLARAGIPSILVARREAPLMALADEIAAEFGLHCVVAPVDLSQNDAADRIVAAAGTREVGLFVSNAGSDDNHALFLDKDETAWLSMIDRNTRTMVRCCHHFGGAMQKRGRGGILLVGSGSCYGGASFMAVYAATKAFTLCFGEGLWAELRAHGVDVLNLVLGRTDTPALRQLLAEQGLPVPDNLARPEEIAEVGLARLPHGPIHNWGQGDDEAGQCPAAAPRRARVLAIDAATKDIFRRREPPSA